MEHITSYLHTAQNRHRNRGEQKSVIRNGAGSAQLEVCCPSFNQSKGAVDWPNMKLRVYMHAYAATLQKERK